ncbi:MAG: extracellular solute-binding protein [Actinocatenispora sp.]
MFRRRLPLALLAGAVATVALSACGGVGSSSDSEGGTGTLKTMGFNPGDEVATSRVQVFKDQNKKITLKMSKGGFDPQQFLSAVSSGNVPDVVYMDRKDVGTYAAKGAIQPLDKCISKQHVDTGNFRTPAMQEVTLSGHVYGIPEFYLTRIVLMSDPVLKQAGLTADDLSTADWATLSASAKKLSTVSGGKVRRIGFDPKLPEFLPMWTAANGASLVTPDGRPNLDDPKVVQALSYAVSLINEQGGWSAFKAFRDTWDLFGKKNEIAERQVGAFPWESWYLNVLAEAGSSGDISGTPFLDKHGRPTTFETGSAWVVPKGAKNPDAACTWVRTMTETSTWMAAAAARQKTVDKSGEPNTGLYTGNKEADTKIRARYVKPTGKPGLDSAIKAYYTAQDYAVAVPASRAGSEINDAWMAAVNRVLTGQQKPAAAMRKAQQDALSAYQSAGN